VQDRPGFDLLLRGIAADNRPQTLESLQEQERLFGEAVRLDPRNSDALARLARAILLQATQVHVPAQHRLDRLERGADAAEKAVALAPNSARAHLAMGLLHMLRGDFERAALTNETAIALDRNLAQAHNNLGNSLVHLGKGREAILSLEQAIRLDPGGPALAAASRTAMGFARLLLGRTYDAVEWFSRALASNPKLARAHAGLALALVAKGDIAAAQRATSDLLGLVPDYRLSETIDALSPSSPAKYREFYDDLLLPAAKRAGLPV
jgi:tetratricopeptide (TPR) repeat protein